jgi:hypothetical protein
MRVWFNGDAIAIDAALMDFQYPLPFVNDLRSRSQQTAENRGQTARTCVDCAGQMQGKCGQKARFCGKVSDVSRFSAA